MTRRISTVQKVVMILLQRISLFIGSFEAVNIELLFEFLSLNLHCFVVPGGIQTSLFNNFVNDAICYILKNQWFNLL